MRRAEVLAAVGVVGLGILMSALPHLVRALRDGSPFWISDTDEIVYLCYAASSLHAGGLSVVDPITGHPGSVYPWLQLMPVVLLVRACGLSAFYLGVFWRIAAGLSIGLAWWVLFRRSVASRRVAFCLAALALCDPGVARGGPLFFLFQELLDVWRHPHGLFLTELMIHPEWRIITPGLSLACFIAYMACLVRPVDYTWEKYTGAALGLLVWVYFYYWTAALLGLLLLGVAERSRLRGCLLAAGIGLVVGAPQLLNNYLLEHYSNSDWLARSDKFVPVGHFADLRWPLAALLTVVLTGFLMARRPHPLRALWFLALSSLLLVNHQMLTGLDVENYHWERYVLAPACTALLFLLFAQHLKVTSRSLGLLGLVTVTFVAMGCYTRIIEATRTEESVFWSQQIDEYERDGFGDVDTVGGTVAGDEPFVDLFVIDHDVRPLNHYAANFSPFVDDTDWQLRMALNSVLCGDTQQSFALDQADQLRNEKWWSWGRKPARRRRMFQRRKALFQVARRDADALIRQYDIRYLAIRKPGGPPPLWRDQWTVVKTGSQVVLYQRNGVR